MPAPRGLTERAGRARMVGGSGIEPLTFAMSTRRSPAELTALVTLTSEAANSRPGRRRNQPLRTTLIVLLQLSICAVFETARLFWKRTRAIASVGKRRSGNWLEGPEGTRRCGGRAGVRRR